MHSLKLVALAFGVALAQGISATEPLIVVDESSARLVLRESGPELSVRLENRLGRVLAANIQVEAVTWNYWRSLKDPLPGRPSTRHLRPGWQQITLPLAADFEALTGESWERLEAACLYYRIEWQPPDETLKQGAWGVIGLPRLLPGAFNLRVLAPALPEPGKPYAVRVLAHHFDGSPAAGVELEGFLSGPSRFQRRSSGVTDVQGHGLMLFDLPGDLRDDDLQIEVTGQREGWVRRFEEDIDLLRTETIHLGTDKPLYQPGQEMHFRALVFDGAGQAIEDVPIDFTLRDDEGQAVAKLTARTSSFGVASGSWTLPQEATTGSYELQAETGLPGGDSFGYRRVQVSRYVLPTFQLQVEPTQPYYLLGESAQVRLQARHFSGPPVIDGTVRIVRGESSSYWSDGDEARGELVAVGRTDSEGTFSGRIELAPEGESLEEWQRYRDFGFLAMVTDPLSGETQERRFDLRLSRDPIHLYLIPQRPLVSNLPMTVYVAAVYADGSPAPCQVRLNLYRSEWQPRLRRYSYDEFPGVLEVSTDRWGLAKAVLPAREEGADLGVTLRARDAVGRTGMEHEGLWWESKGLQLQVAEHMPAEGEDLTVELSSYPPYPAAFVEVSNGTDLLLTRRVPLRDGRGETSFSYRPEFRGELTARAFVLGEEVFQAATRVLYPGAERGLELEVALDGTAHRPGQAVQARLRVRSPEPLESVLGLSVVDRALEERFASDFGRGKTPRPSIFPETHGGPEVAGLNMAGLRKLPREVVRERGLELAAEMILETVDYDYWLNDLTRWWAEPSDRLGQAVAGQFSGAVAALNEIFQENQRFPSSRQELAAFLTPAGIQLETFLDPWGNGYRFRWTALQRDRFLWADSGGSDEAFGTADDRAFLIARRPYFAFYESILSSAVRDYQASHGDTIRDALTFVKVMEAAGWDFAALRDPWGEPYRPEFSIEGGSDVLQVVSAGPDRQFETLDDVAQEPLLRWPYFAALGQRIDAALERAARSRGRPVAELEGLNAALAEEGIRLDRLLDRWGQPYRVEFHLQGSNVVVRFYSGGPSGAFERSGFGDDFRIWESVSGDYLAGDRATIAEAFERYVRQHPGVPGDGEELKAGLRAVGLDLDQLRDPFGKPYYLASQESYRAIQFYRTENRVQYGGGGPTEELTADPVDLYLFRLCSRGRDGLELTDDDAIAFSFTYLAPAGKPGSAEAGSTWMGLAAAGSKTLSDSGQGAVRGTVTDATGAVIPGATVTVLDSQGRVLASVLTDSMGSYLVGPLPGGLYEIRHELTGFRPTVIVGVPVRPATVIEVEAVLEIGEVSEVVMVSSGVSRVETEHATLSGGNPAQQAGSGVARTTPPVRRYFPETVLWQPALEVGSDGLAQLEFKLPDSVTRWKLAAVASTRDGRIATTEVEFTATLPFYAQLEPPPILTKGDTVQLPVVIRNQLERPQAVDLAMEVGDWGRLLGEARQRLEVNAGRSAAAVFTVSADEVTDGGPLRVRALAGDAADAIEKPVAVRPDRQEIFQQQTRLLERAARFSFEIPADGLPGSAVLQIFPDLLATLLDAADGILQRPYGCFEQTISTTFPNLMVLRLLEARGEPTETVAKARRFLDLGLGKILSFQSEDGGFGYWHGSSPNLSLTAYGLSLLDAAHGVGALPDEPLRHALSWLLDQQRNDGLWTDDWSSNAWLVRSLAELCDDCAWLSAVEAADLSRRLEASVGRGLDALEEAFARQPRLFDAYGLSNLISAQVATGRDLHLEAAVRRLGQLAEPGAGKVIWSPRDPTPFWGWGLAGRLETTGLALQALAAAGKRVSGQALQRQISDLEGPALLYLVENQDRYGVWYSTRATVQVLRVIEAVYPDGKSASGRLRISVNGNPAAVVEPAKRSQPGPLRIDLSSLLRPGENAVEVLSAESAGPLILQVVSRYFQDWKFSGPASEVEAGGLKLGVVFDRTRLSVGEEVAVRFRVQSGGAGRVWGRMMLAEVGLPPGAEVDRSSVRGLDRTYVSHFEVQPDRLIVYWWSRGGSDSFTFTFRPRYALNALTTRHLAYDYYNPDASVELAPARFEVIANRESPSR